MAVDGVSFEIVSGSIHALVGENGAGKSTLIKMLSGVYGPSSGEIVVRGRPAVFRTPLDAQAAGINTVHQERTLISTLTALENIFLGREVFAAHGGRLFGVVDTKRMYQRVRQLCDDFNFDPRKLHTTVEDLDAFSMQVVEIIKALAFNADLIIMDEPTGGLSEKEREILFNHMEKLRARGISLLWVTHQLEELRGLADRITVLRDGGLVGTTDGDDVTPQDIARMMVGRNVDSIESVVAEAKDCEEAPLEERDLLRIERISAEGVNNCSFSV
ncbi:MAG TPA: ATP-binding cassette domain-containing protein, partial [Alphaproteobacteria bacterium]|nr:ATP-binding cassette domain-containing protein [Alphaproteobacteria bacterium]